ncbi:MAG: L-threonylcarbamoyladenylate synthase [Patescibacteria group bacterium]
MDQIASAVKILQAGGLIIFPTETCYGAGVDATNPQAVNKLLAYKTRREGKPLSIAVTDKTMASKYVKLNTTAVNLYTKFLPGPLTIVSRARHRVATGIESETGTLAIRIPDYPLVHKLLKSFGKPITATSANVSYKPRPYSIPQLLKYTSKKQQKLIDLIIDVGQLPFRPVSTIVDTTLDDPLILRQGKITLSHSRCVITNSPQETINLAKTLMLKNWKQLQTHPLLFLLIGNLGAGKTQFAKGIGKFLQINQPITSPTYTLEKEYGFNRHKISGKFLHLDTWRIQNPEELALLNLEKRLLPKTVCVIEWADRTIAYFQRLAKKSHARLIILSLSTVAESFPNQRRITVSR